MIQLVLAAGFGLSSCAKYLDIVPDNVFQYEDMFVSRVRAFNALTGIYMGTPYDQNNIGPWTLGDEWVVVNPTVDASRTLIQGQSVMKGNQSTVNTLMSLWDGNNTIANLWVVIRDCDMFVQNIDKVPDMTAEERADWKGQAKFLRAYYLFMLVQNYGPIIIPKTADPNALDEDLYMPRSKVEDCFDYIIQLIDESLPYLRTKAGYNELGMVDKAIAIAMKARILVYRASPFFNGNSEYYENFLDRNGEPFFSMQEDREKWKKAADAAQEAIDFCEEAGFELYNFTGRFYDYDAQDYADNPEKMQILYDLKMRITERWNREIIWGNTRMTTVTMPRIACIKKPEGLGGPASAGDGDAYGAASYQAMARYYTKHGLPLEDDKTVVFNTLHQIVITPEENDPQYVELKGFMQPGQPTINMYLNREPRFYADLGITGGYYRSHQIRINTMMFAGTHGGFIQATHGQNYNVTGIAIQKCVHPESYQYSSYNYQVVAPYPLMRMADLYLLKAEAMNEYYGPSQEVYDAINKVRSRAGIPDVEESYSNPDWVSDEALGKHLTKEGMREIILNERAVEFAFEGAHRFYDMQRWKRSVVEFSKPIWGWNYMGTSAVPFFNQTIVQGRKWSISDCLWPIPLSEMDKNRNLIQNPGW